MDRDDVVYVDMDRYGMISLFHAIFMVSFASMVLHNNLVPTELSWQTNTTSHIRSMAIPTNL